MEGSMIGWHIMEVDLIYIHKNDKVQFLKLSICVPNPSWLRTPSGCLMQCLFLPDHAVEHFCFSY